jgi:hypothetical protein
LGAFAIRSIFSVILYATTSSGIDGGWTTFLSESTSGYAGSVVASGAVGLSNNVRSSFCKARLVLDDTTPIGGELIADNPSGTGWMSLSPIGQITFSAGAHTISLQVATTGGSQCTALVSGDIHRGSLQFVEYAIN